LKIMIEMINFYYGTLPEVFIEVLKGLFYHILTFILRKD